MSEDKFLPPGSRKAKEKGCTCPFVDKPEGNGTATGPMTGTPPNRRQQMTWDIDTDCPLHAELVDDYLLGGGLKTGEFDADAEDD